MTEAERWWECTEGLSCELNDVAELEGWVVLCMLFSALGSVTSFLEETRCRRFLTLADLDRLCL